METFAIDASPEDDLEIYRQIFINAHEGICVCQDGRVVFANPAFCAMTGYSSEELYSQSLLAIVHPEDHAHVISEYTKRMQGIPDGSRYEFRGITKAGETRWLLMSAVLISWNGRPAALDFVSDVGELRRAREMEYRERVKAETYQAKIEERQRAEAEKDALEKQLRQSQVFEAVGLLAGGVAHDFNNLLGGVMSCLYLARMKHNGEDAELSELDNAQNLCVRGRELTRRLLDVAKRRPGTAKPISVQSLLEEVKMLLERTLPKQIRLSFLTEPDLPLLNIDRSTLTAALLNLASNSLDAMPDGGDLKIRIHREKCESGNVLFEVADNGIGMDREVQERVFEPFFTTKPPGKGTGLGLSMVYAMARDAGGGVRLVSSPGNGTTVTIVLPAFSCEVPGEEKGPCPVRHPLTRSCILIVEDEETILAFEEEVLKRAGYRVLKATGMLSAIETLRGHADEVGLIVLDLVMPGGGDQLSRILKRLQPELPILFATGRYDLAEAMDPAANVVPKPFSEGELLDGVAKALRPGSRVSRPGKAKSRKAKGK